MALLGISARVGGLLLAGGLVVSAQTAPAREYQIKAVFLFNFAQFVEWRPADFADANSPIVIGVLGADPFGAYLDETVMGEKVDNRPLTVERYRTVDEIKACHILFISRSETNRLLPILSGLNGRNVLVVGDSDNFVQRGGMIQLANAQNKVRLIVNAEAAKAANLTISSKLLRSAEVVTPSRK